MVKENCTNHQYEPASWKVKYVGDKCIAYRECIECGKVIEFPNGEDYLAEINEQDDATKIFTLFNHIDSNREEIVPLLCDFLKLYFSHLNKDGRVGLIQKMKEIKQAPTISSENAYYIQLLTTFIAENRIDDNFDQIFEEFYAYNLSAPVSDKGFHHS